MNEVLDNFEEKRKKKKNYAQKSLQQFIIAVISLVIAIGILWFVIMPKFGVKMQRPNYTFVFTIFSFVIFTIRGSLNAIRSYSLKEPSSIIKKVGMIGNALLFCLIAGYFIYSYEIILQIFTSPSREVNSFE